MKITLALLAFIPALASAGPFDGTWVAKIDTFKTTGKPDTFLVADGMYECGACYPGLKIKADGTDQKVTGHAYYDTASAKVIDARRVQSNTHLAGKLVGERTFTVATDGKTMSEEFISYEGANPSKGKLFFARVAAGPAGSHALSGSWQVQENGNSLSADLLTVTFAQMPDGLKMNTPTGQSYDAKFDGKDYPMAGDPGKTMVALKRVDAKTIQETDSRGGKVTDIYLYKVSADGKSMHVVDDDKLHETKTTFTQEKKAM
jgi:hypothetical protein